MESLSPPPVDKADYSKASSPRCARGSVGANTRAYDYAKQAIDLEEVGKIRASQKAKRQAMEWLRKTMKIEARYPTFTRDEYLVRRERLNGR